MEQHKKQHFNGVNDDLEMTTTTSSTHHTAEVNPLRSSYRAAAKAWRDSEYDRLVVPIQAVDDAWDAMQMTVLECVRKHAAYVFDADLQSGCGEDIIATEFYIVARPVRAAVVSAVETIIGRALNDCDSLEKDVDVFVDRVVTAYHAAVACALKVRNACL